jgi:hypothetical protein
LAGQRIVEGQHHRLVHAADGQLAELVAQRAHAGGGQIGLVQLLRKVVARVGLEGQHAGGQAALRGFGTQQSQHGLVATVHPIKVANGDRAGGHDRGAEGL